VVAATIEMSQASVAPHERTVTMPLGIPEITLGWSAIHWAGKYLRQPDGERAGQRWEFTESQVRFILWWYALDELGRWIFTHGVRRLPKGSGKSPFAAVLALIELLAPVRFQGWDDAAPGLVTGKPVGLPLVQIGATAESQASINTMRMVRALCPPRSRLISEYDLEVGKTQVVAPAGKQLSLITNSAAASEGALTTFAVLDQTELFTTANGGVDLAQVIDRNLAKSKSRGIETSNSWMPGKESVAEETSKAWFAGEEGRTKGRARTLMDIRMAPPDIDFEDVASIIKGVEFAYGDCYWVDAEDIVMNHILDPRTPLDVSKRFYLNWPTVAEDAWIEPAEWAAMKDLEFDLLDGEDIALGFDGSRTRDATALIGCHIETGYVFVIDIWETSYSGDEFKPEQIPVHEVDSAVARAFDRWNVKAFFADVREWEGFTKVTWPEKYADQLNPDEGAVWPVRGGRDPQPIAFDMRSHISDFTAAAEMVQKEIEDGAFKHDGDYRLARHVANARNYPNQWGNSISKESPDSPDKIDGAVAMVIARHARRLVLASENYGKASRQKQKTGNVWSWS